MTKPSGTLISKMLKWWVSLFRKPHVTCITVLQRLIYVSVPRPRSGKTIFIACFPKSGSTYLSALLARVTGFEKTMLVHQRMHDKDNSNAGYHNEQEIDEIRNIQYWGVDKVIQQHAKGTENNIRIMKESGIKPVILVRDIFDVIQSLHDHFLEHSIKGPTGFVHKEFYSMATEERLLYIARVHTPWYFNFVISWQEATRDLGCLWISYEELFANQRATVIRILEFYDLHIEEERIESSIAAISEVNTLLNKGVVGRGASLPGECRNVIMDIARCWNLDGDALARIGIKLENQV